jgi:hypothetical protein
LPDGWPIYAEAIVSPGVDEEARRNAASEPAIPLAEPVHYPAAARDGDPGASRLVEQEGVEAATVQVPAAAMRTIEEVLVVESGMSPARYNPRRLERLTTLEGVPKAKTAQKRIRFGWQGFAKPLVISVGGLE